MGDEKELSKPAPWIFRRKLSSTHFARFFRGAQPLHQRATIAAMFSLGDAYDIFMGRWSARLAPLLVQCAGVIDGDDVLDIGSGTGALTAAIAAAAPSSRIVGIDRSEPYVAVARARQTSSRVRFDVGDAQHLPFDDATFDRTLSMLTLNFVPEPEDALREMIRVTRPGGIVAAAVWDYSEGMEMLRVFWDEAIALAPDRRAEDEGNMPLSRRGDLAALWREHHMEQVADMPLTIETPFASFEDFWSPFLLQQGPAGAYVATLSPDERDRLERNLRERLLGRGPDRPITLRARAWAVTGVVPSTGNSAG